MEPLKTYDYLTAARERVFDWVRPLGEEGWRREFPIGLGSLGRTLTHTMICEWAYAERLRGRTPPAYETWPIQDEHPPAFETVERVWREQAKETRATLAGIRGETGGGWEEPFEFRSQNADGRGVIVTATPGEIFMQLVVHEVHHRSQAMAMLRQMGVAAENLDLGYFVFGRREV